MEDIERQLPFLKWAGGKRKILNDIKKILPESIERYYEPFVGAGTVALNVEARETFISDVNKDLILTWQTVQNNCDDLIKETETLFTSDTNTSASYYKLRNEFNEEASGIRKAALFIYLNKHGFNGMCRYNSNGKFNIPYGQRKSVGFDSERIKKVSERIQGWKIYHCGFSEVLSIVNIGDVVYCDPPYIGEKKTNKGTEFTSYAPEDFTLLDQVVLAKEASAAAQRGAIVVISNHDMKLTRALYEGMGGTINDYKIKSMRTIAADPENRHKASEILAIFKKGKTILTTSENRVDSVR